MTAPGRARLEDLGPGRILDALAEGVFVAAPDGRVVCMNPALREILGVDETPGSIADMRDVLQVRAADGSADDLAKAPSTLALQGQRARGRYRVRRPSDGAEIVVDAESAPVREDGRVVAAVVAVRDVTASVDADREREDFLSIVSHELKTPLTPLKALAQLLRARIRRSRQGTPLDVDALDRNLATIERQVDRMNALVNDILEVSRAGRGTFQLHTGEFDLARVVRDTAQRYVEATAEEGRHTFEIEVPPSLVVTGDQSRIEQVVWNLVGNAVKYSPRGGRVEVRLAQDGAATLTIRDQGIGIDPAELPAIGRKPFERGSGRAATFAGMGLGIYVSRLVAEGHGGSLDLTSDGDDKGTTVTLRLPLG